MKGSVFYLKKYLFIIACIVFVLSINKVKSKEDIIIPTDSIRFRVVANSNSELDIKTKISLKNKLENKIFELVKDSSSREETEKIIVNNLENINSFVNQELNNNYYKIDYGKNYFPSKIYKGVVYKEGIYDSLVVTIGDGKGKNWWCVLFPPLCLMEENNTTNDVEYHLYISRIINNLK